MVSGWERLRVEMDAADQTAEEEARTGSTTGLEVIKKHSPDELTEALATAAPKRFTRLVEAELVAPYRHPHLIWGIGLNYSEHAADLSAVAPQDAPASFIKGDHTLIGPGEEIELPPQSQRVTAEAELGLIIGRDTYRVSVEEALDHVWGVVPILDQTAEDILQLNPRFLTRSKNFPTFFSFGPTITPIGEARALPGGLDGIEVTTVLNGQVHRTNTVAHMTFGLAQLVSLHSHVLPFRAGDIISTGTPGAVPLSDGDVAEARVAGIGALRNRVSTAD